MAILKWIQLVTAHSVEQSDIKTEPVLPVLWLAGQARQEVEAVTGWYFPTGQEVQMPP
jgi:hypothetical protein